MNIYLGNLRLKDIVHDEHLDTVTNFLDNNGFKHTSRTDDIEKQEGNFHIYDIPRQIHICGESKASDFVGFLKKNNLESSFKGSVGVMVVTESEE